MTFYVQYHESLDYKLIIFLPSEYFRKEPLDNDGIKVLFRIPHQPLYILIADRVPRLLFDYSEENT